VNGPGARVLRLPSLASAGRQAALIALCGALAYVNALPGAFHYDDFHSLVDNPAVRSLANLPRFFTDPGQFSADAGKAMYRPLLLFSYAANYAAGGYAAVGYVLVNLAVHLACSLLVWHLGRRLLGASGAALLAGLVFALHPLATEPVNYVSSRSESLAACGYLGAMALHGAGRRRPRLAWLAPLAYAAALLVKSVAITFPAAVWLYDRVAGVPAGAPAPRGRRYLSYLVLTAVYLGVITANGFLPHSLAAPVRGPGAQLWTQTKAVGYYLQRLALPCHLSIEPQFSVSTSPEQAAVLAGVVLLASLVFLCWWGWGLGVPAFCLAWVLLVLLPASAMPLNMLVNERRLYLALAGLAWLAGWLARRGGGRWLWAALPCLAVCTLQRNPVWASELSLWQDAVRQGPRMYRAQTNLGKALQESGDAAGAMAAYRQALAIDPEPGDAYNNIGTLLHLGGDASAAIGWYRQALARYPDYEEIHQNVADAWAELGQLDSATAEYARAVAIDDRNGSIWSNYGQTLYQAGRWAEAESAWQRAAVLLPERAEPRNNLGNLYSRQGQLDRAIDCYRQALACAADDRASIWVNLADTYRQAGDLQQAAAAAEQALALAPQHPGALLQQGRILRQAGQLAAAAQVLAQATAADSAAPRPRVEWAEVLAAQGRHDAAAEQFSRVVAADPTHSRAWFGLACSLDALARRAAATAAYEQFLSHWQRSDERQAHARSRLRQLAGLP
jgi:tetratricopeptide (TPR) repeat protein